MVKHHFPTNQMQTQDQQLVYLFVLQNKNHDLLFVAKIREKNGFKVRHIHGARVVKGASTVGGKNGGGGISG